MHIEIFFTVDSLTVKREDVDMTNIEVVADHMEVGPFKFHWDYVLIFVAMRFLQGGGSGTGMS